MGAYGSASLSDFQQPDVGERTYVDGIDRLRGAEDAADLSVEAEQRREFLPRVLSEPNDRRIPSALHEQAATASGTRT